MTRCHQTLQILAADAADASATAGGAWIKLLPAGSFKTRDGRGPFSTGDKIIMHAIVDRTLAFLAGTEMMIDYDHQAVFSAVEGIGGTAKAAGWVKEYDVRGDGIWGRVEWTAAAKAAIEAAEYRYISPTFLSDKKTGRVTQLMNAALLNMPAMDLEAVAARACFTLSKGKSMEDEILEALGLSEGAGVADAVAAIAALQAGQATIAAAAGLGKDASTEAITAAVTKAVKSTTPDPAKYVPIEQVEAMQESLNALAATVTGDKAEAAVDAAIEEGKLAPALKDWALSLAKSDLEKFRAFADKSPVLTSTQLGNAKKTETDGDLDEADLQVMSQMGLSREEMIAAKREDGA